jgi:plastocyanin
VVALVLSLGLVATACAEDQPSISAGGEGQEDQGEEEGTVTIAGQEATNHGSEDVSGASEAEVELDNFYFEPTVLEGEAGQTLSVSLHNEGAAPHTFTIEDQNVDEELQPGDEATVEVTFPESGAVAYFCRFHVGGGMAGGLSVGGDLEAGSGSTGTSGETSDDSGSGGGY